MEPGAVEVKAESKKDSRFLSGNRCFYIPLEKVSLRFLFNALIIVGIGGLIFGYDIAVIAGALGKMSSEFDLDSVDKGLVVSFIYIGAVFGSIWGGPLADYIGRWKTIHLQNVIFVAGAVAITFAEDLTSLYIGRFLVGVASALSGIAEVPYLLEISPTELRGPITTTYEIAVCVGVLLSFVLGLVLNSLSDGWRILFGIPALLAVVQSLSMLVLPESPQWLAMAKSDFEAAEKSFSMIVDNHDNDNYRFVRSILQTTLSKQPEDSSQHRLISTTDNHAKHGDEETARYTPLDAAANGQVYMRYSKSTDDVVQGMYEYAFPLILIVLLQLLIQFTGGVVIRNYAPIIFEDSGFSTTSSLLINVALGLLKLLISIFSAGFMERSGRMQLLLYSTYTVGIGMTISMSGFLLKRFDAAGNAVQCALFLIGCFLTIGGYSFGFGSVPWVLSAEMFPTSIRGWAMSISLISSNIAQGITNFGFLPLADLISPEVVFGLFAVMNIVTWAFVVGWMVETRDLPPKLISHQLYSTPGTRCLKATCCKRT